VAANLSATARSSVVRVPGRAGWSLTDLFGGARFPDVGPDGTVMMTWGSRDFYWLLLTPPDGTTTGSATTGSTTAGGERA